MVHSGARRSGFTLLEVLVASTVLVVLMAAIFLVLRSSQDDYAVDSRAVELQSQAARARSILERDFTEASIDYIYTARIANTSSTYSFTSKFYDASAGVSQCQNSACVWSVDAQGAPIEPRSNLTSIYVDWTGTVYSYRVGKVWSSLPAGSTCPACGQPVLPAANVGGAMLLSPRDSLGDFVLSDGPDNRPDWQAILLYVPVRDTKTGVSALRRFAVYLSDLENVDPATGNPPNPIYAAPGSYFYDYETPGWTLWDNDNPVGNPSLLDLFDLDQDGTVSFDPQNRDVMDYEAFDLSGDWIYYYRYRASPDYRMFYVSINRGTGETWISLYFTAGAEYFYRYGYFVRQSELVARGVTTADFSMNRTNPYSITNPEGVVEENIVRITLGMDAAFAGPGGTRRLDRVQILQVCPKN
ncbi:MAG: prepilin-type N-terminal cleavage/methylation domain-containing protein [Planctomycetes bacterium]|nr:prepilin-type N-terminal cleavage/methylation domain-containing protein [Planctomycetota bacterium]